MFQFIDLIYRTVTIFISGDGVARNSHSRVIIGLAIYGHYLFFFSL